MNKKSSPNTIQTVLDPTLCVKKQIGLSKNVFSLRLLSLSLTKLHFDLIFINSHLFFPFSNFIFYPYSQFFTILFIFSILFYFIHILIFILFYPYSQFYFNLSIFSILFCPYFQF